MGASYSKADECMHTGKAYERVVGGMVFDPWRGSGRRACARAL